MSTLYIGAPRDRYQLEGLVKKWLRKGRAFLEVRRLMHERSTNDDLSYWEAYNMNKQEVRLRLVKIYK
jgi:hypothetical protein